MATYALQLFAEYLKLSPVNPIPEHIKGELNTEADNISRVNKLFPTERSHIFDVPYHILLEQVCQKYKKIRNWEVFLPSPELLSSLSYVVYSDVLTEGPRVEATLGRFVPVNSFFSGSANNTTYSNTYFL